MLPGLGMQHLRCIRIVKCRRGHVDRHAAAEARPFMQIHLFCYAIDLAESKNDALIPFFILRQPPIFKRSVSVQHDVGNVADGFELVASLVRAAPHFVDVDSVV